MMVVYKLDNTSMEILYWVGVCCLHWYIELTILLEIVVHFP